MILRTSSFRKKSVRIVNFYISFKHLPNLNREWLKAPFHHYFRFFELSDFSSERNQKDILQLHQARPLINLFLFIYAIKALKLGITESATGRPPESVLRSVLWDKRRIKWVLPRAKHGI